MHVHVLSRECTNTPGVHVWMHRTLQLFLVVPYYLIKKLISGSPLKKVLICSLYSLNLITEKLGHIQFVFMIIHLLSEYADKIRSKQGIAYRAFRSEVNGGSPTPDLSSPKKPFSPSQKESWIGPLSKFNCLFDLIFVRAHFLTPCTLVLM